MKTTTSLLGAVMRPLSAATLLHTIRSDPGMTTIYYANRYFGADKKMEIDHLVWKELKQHGKVTLDRIDGPDAPPRWMPLFYYPKRHMVRPHNPDEEDLSVLQGYSNENAVDSHTGEVTSEDVPAPEDRESAILRLVHSNPGKDIQFYINELPEEYQPGTAQAFRRLRLAGVLQRTQTAQGTFTWSC